MLKNANYFLPSKRLLSLDFLRDVLSGAKKLLKLAEIEGLVELPRFREINITKLWNELKGDKKISAYVPNSCLDKKTIPNRDYFLTVG